MPSLSDKFKSMGVNLGAKPAQPPAAPEQDALERPAESVSRLFPRTEKKAVAIDQVVAGRYLPTIYGEIFGSEKIYPPDYTHGVSQLTRTHSIQTISQWARVSQLSGSALDGFVFLDTETTGLAGGTGTLAFMVGVGRHTLEGFRLMQFFMRTPGEESALLAALSEWMEPCEAIVTYNGKSFDAPLLNTRYVMQGLTSPLIGVPHYDLLHLARRLWRDRLSNRSLKSIENDILGATRTQEEVPGWLIPELYFEYLRSGDASPMSGIFYHNALDILSLAALFGHTSRMLDDPFSFKDTPGLDLVSLAKLYEDLGDLDKAIHLYEVGMEQDLPEEFFWKTVERFAMLYKHQRNWPAAAALWEKAAGHGEIYAFVELAKYYEHEQRDPARAAEWTTRALDQVSQPRFPPYLRNQWRADLDRRLIRLKSKIT